MFWLFPTLVEAENHQGQYSLPSVVAAQCEDLYTRIAPQVQAQGLENPR
jgi:hypothetical protein